MKTIWDWSLGSEAKRMIGSAHSISNGFFHLHHFYPFPWDPQTSYLHQGVYLPPLSYLSLPDFWHRSLTYDNQSMSLPPQLSDLHQAIISQLSSLHLPTPDFSALQKQWDSIALRFFRLIRTLAPYAPYIKSLTIHPTYFGTAGSFNWGPETIVYLRVDQPVTTLAECILTSLTRPYLYKTRHATWEESEFLVDYLLQETELARLFPTPHLGTLESLRHQTPASVISASDLFLRQIGAPTLTSQAFSVKNSTLYFGDCPLTTLTSREHSVLTKLIEKAPSPATTDELSDLLFPNVEKFSLAALTKTIERLRSKLESSGISRHYLATASGIGYYLKN
ncbi:MAG: hypothetical protein ACD_40C00324G0001 [uncultured bacterium]|nr:MAG: hypothetical protein ACD_40C00324G0001 [uncultured bacterium]